jgi:hypothetical protein
MLYSIMKTALLFEPKIATVSENIQAARSLADA